MSCKTLYPVIGGEKLMSFLNYWIGKLRSRIFLGDLELFPPTTVEDRGVLCMQSSILQSVFHRSIHLHGILVFLYFYPR